MKKIRVSLFEEWNFMLDTRLGMRVSVKGLLGTFIGKFFFGAAAFLFVLDRLCFF